MKRARGFTLVEMVVAIVLLGILSMVMVPLLQLPMSAHLSATRRAALANELDVTVARLRADLAQALPNSVRVRQVGARHFVEYLEVRASGRYRNGASGAAQSCPATCSAPGANDVLEFACVESCFTTLGPLDGSAPVAASDWVVVNPLGPGIANGDPYFGGSGMPVGGIKSRLQSIAAVGTDQRLTMTPHSFVLAPANRRFYVVATPVSYECNPATQRLTRYWGYAVAAAQPAAFGAAGHWHHGLQLRLHRHRRRGRRRPVDGLAAQQPAGEQPGCRPGRVGRVGVGVQREGSIMIRRQQGVSVVLMLALIVLLGGMLVFTVSVSSSMHAGAAREIGAARAAQAAAAGLEGGRFRVRMGAAANCAAATNLTLPLASGAHPVTVRCTLTGTHAEGAATVRTYQLTATACRPAAAGACPNAVVSSDYVEALATGSSER